MAKKHWQICNWNASNYRYKYGRVETVHLENVPPIVLDTALRAVRLIDNGLYGVDLKLIGDKVYIIEINDNPNIDDGIENSILKDDLYKKILISFINKIDRAKNFDGISSYLNFDNQLFSRIGLGFRNSDV
jgi:glutathione synthase/RimK-type ligase-like ATP-grasp enzyme